MTTMIVFFLEHSDWGSAFELLLSPNRAYWYGAISIVAAIYTESTNNVTPKRISWYMLSGLVLGLSLFFPFTHYLIEAQIDINLAVMPALMLILAVALLIGQLGGWGVLHFSARPRYRLWTQIAAYASAQAEKVGAQIKINDAVIEDPKRRLEEWFEKQKPKS